MASCCVTTGRTRAGVAVGLIYNLNNSDEFQIKLSTTKKKKKKKDVRLCFIRLLLITNMAMNLKYISYILYPHEWMHLNQMTVLVNE